MQEAVTLIILSAINIVGLSFMAYQNNKTLREMQQGMLTMGMLRRASSAHDFSILSQAESAVNAQAEEDIIPPNPETIPDYISADLISKVRNNI